MVFILMLCITIGYAALNSTLNINGKSNISKNNWDIHFDNISVIDGSVEAVKIPTVTDKTTVDFEVALNLPGDFYEFTVDVVNAGSIDAMIESINKTSDLTLEQEKYLNYIIEYQNGEQITTKQLVKKEDFVRLKVRVEYKSDIIASDLPTITETLNLGFVVNYVQSDGTGSSVKDNGVKSIYTLVSGDLDTPGSEISIGDEHFYIMDSDEESLTILTKYNLYAGYKCDSNLYSCTPYGEEATGLQDSNMRAYVPGLSSREGIIEFSETNYWAGESSEYPLYVYDENSILYSYVENYKEYIEEKEATVREARLITYEEMIYFGCINANETISCGGVPKWLLANGYWTGSAKEDGRMYAVDSRGFLYDQVPNNNLVFGIRPVLVLNR